MSRAYYNEWDPYAAQWLRNLIAKGLIAEGDVDERSIVEVQPDELKGYTQVHFFAGIGGWSLAARIAGWPDDRPLWTGSCPCQPFSGAGKGKGEADERHLWPEMRRLVGACRPDVVAGEQVASKAGRLWLAGVRADLEDMAYVPWAADICAASTGAPHIRQRIWWVADGHGRRQQELAQCDGEPRSWIEASRRNDAGGRGVLDGMADTNGTGTSRQREHGGYSEEPQRLRPGSGRSSGVGRLGEPSREGLEGGRRTSGGAATRAR